MSTELYIILIIIFRYPQYNAVTNPDEIAYEWCLKGIDPPSFEKLWIGHNVGKLGEKDQRKLCVFFI